MVNTQFRIEANRARAGDHHLDLRHRGNSAPGKTPAPDETRAGRLPLMNQRKQERMPGE